MYFNIMITFSYATIGVMSGTSLDGIDLSYSVLRKENAWDFRIIHAETIAYPLDWQSRLREAYTYNTEQLKILDQEYTRFLGSVISDFIKKNNIRSIEAVCSHGHTILHQPALGVTLQIGNQKELAALIGYKVICDFRVQDVKLGGQGAPLVPIGDQLLFGQYEYCVNLGGFANISMQMGSERIAYDICPVNIVLNKIVARLGYVYDDRGEIAASGALISDLLEELEMLSYYEKKPPKSLGLEWVEQVIVPILKKYESTGEAAILHTFCIHIARQIAKQLDVIGVGKALFTGGGVYNVFLIKEIKKYTSTTIVVPDPTVVEYKEALIFSFLGVLRLRDEPNCLKSVTGASRNHSSGNIFNP